MGRSGRGGKTIAAVLIDMNGFKQANDTLGHEAGDQLLVAFGRILRASVFGTDVVGRLGGYEFAIVPHDITTDRAVPVLPRARTVNGVPKLDRDDLVPPSDPWPDAPVGGGDWPSPVPDDSPARPGRNRWWLLVPVVVVAIAAAVALGLALRPSHPHRPKAMPTPTLAVPAPTVVASPATATRTVVYVVTAGSGDIGSVQYTDQDGAIINRGGIDLPWRVTFQVTGERHPLVLIAQRHQGGTGPVTCSITVDGKVLSTTTQTGRYGAPECSA